MADEGVPYLAPVPIELGLLSDDDLDALTYAAHLLKRLPNRIDLPGGDIGGHSTRTLYIAHLRHELDQIVSLRRGTG